MSVFDLTTFNVERARRNLVEKGMPFTSSKDDAWVMAWTVASELDLGGADRIEFREDRIHVISEGAEDFDFSRLGAMRAAKIIREENGPVYEFAYLSVYSEIREGRHGTDAVTIIDIQFKVPE